MHIDSNSVTQSH